MIKKRKILPSDPDVTAYSDIAFLLIIFFSLTTSFTLPFGREVDMPAAAQPEDKKEDTNVPSVTITTDRIMFSEGDTDSKEVNTYELRQRLAQYRFHARPKNDCAVIVEIAEDVTYQRYYEIVTMIAESGGTIAMVQN
jgi:biopolymer transport protein ExbD